MSVTLKPLGRKVPNDFTHIQKYPLSAIMEETVTNVEKELKLPSWHWDWDQGHEGACVGFGSSMMMSILNKKRYIPTWLWNEAKIIDEWPDTNPGDDNGTSVRAACDILRSKGHVAKRWGFLKPKLVEGITANRWATSIDQIRTTISLGVPVAIGVNWYENFDSPQLVGNEYFIGRGSLGSVRGGHCVCLYGASDQRQAFKIKNSWGRDFPLAYMPYSTMQRLLHEAGEATLVTDR